MLKASPFPLGSSPSFCRRLYGYLCGPFLFMTREFNFPRKVSFRWLVNTKQNFHLCSGVLVKFICWWPTCKRRKKTAFIFLKVRQIATQKFLEWKVNQVALEGHLFWEKNLLKTFWWQLWNFRGRVLVVKYLR